MVCFVLFVFKDGVDFDVVEVVVELLYDLLN